jgi:predicted dehydrogenase/threonine dehydrogenase-like Zn-dependent dehydrogenase
MKQVLQNLRSGETTVVEVPVPQPQPGMALVKTSTSLVSAGTERMLVDFTSKSLLGKARSRPDLARQVIDKARREGILTTIEAAFNRLDQPMPLGYSSAGRIIDLGEDVSGFKAGQRVACGGGGYAVHAEYALVPKNLLALLPDNVDDESAAFTTLGSIALHGFRLAEPSIGDQVTVIGLGLLGLLTTAIANAAGCRVLGIDLDPERVKLAEAMGAELSAKRDEAESAAQSISRGRGSDVVIICADTSSTDPIELAGTIARDRARIVATGAVGLEIPRKIYYEKELSFINSRSYGPGRYDPAYEEGGQDYPLGYVRWTEGRNLESFIDLLSNDRIDVHPLITHRFSIEQAPQAYDLISREDDGSHFLGILLTYKTADSDDIGFAPPPEDKVTNNIASSETGKNLPTGQVHLGVLGAGNFASAVLLPAINNIDQVKFIGIASASGLSAQNAADKFNFNYATSNVDKIISDPDINTVAILTRHNLHAHQVIQALDAGKHVFCEKPLALTLQELEDIYYLMSKQHQKNQVLTVGFNRRFAPFSMQLKDFLGKRQEPLMAHYRINAGYLPTTHWLHDPTQGGGRIIGEGCHFIDYLTFLVGEPPSSVTAFALPDAGRYQEDNVHLTLNFPDGSIGSIDYLANGDPAVAKERLEVFNAGKVAVLDDFRSIEFIQGGKKTIKRSRLRQDKGHRAEWIAFNKAINHSGQPPIPYNQLYGISLASILSVEALRSGETIPIPTWKQS